MEDPIQIDEEPESKLKKIIILLIGIFLVLLMITYIFVGFPIGGILIAPHFEAKAGLLGTTFGGNHLACAAGLAVLEIIEEENLVHNARKIGDHLIAELTKINQIKEVRGKGLMIGNLINNQFGGSGNMPLGSALSIIMMGVVMLSLLVYVFANRQESSA